jgi:uncharacterized protein (DUF2267 family)
MDTEPFFDEVAWRGGFEDVARASRLVEEVLRAFGEELVPDEARGLAHALPEPLAGWILAGPHTGVLSADALYRRVAERTGTPLGFAIEHTRVVLGALGHRLPETTLLRLRRHLSPDLGELFAPRPAPSPPLHLRRTPEPPPGEGHTLATGRPGSRHPLSEAKKLSSSPGLTQEREHETLAEGRPGPERALREKGR